MKSIALFCLFFLGLQVNAQTPPAEVVSLASHFAGADVFDVKSNELDPMLRNYVLAVYGPTKATQAKLCLQSNGFVADSDQIGTFSQSSLAWAMIQRDLTNRLDGQSVPAVEKELAASQASFNTLVSQGMIFGFDGQKQNACGAPTDYLLVLDTTNQMVYGIDLSPCDGE